MNCNLVGIFSAATPWALLRCPLTLAAMCLHHRNRISACEKKSASLPARSQKWNRDYKSGI